MVLLHLRQLSLNAGCKIYTEEGSRCCKRSPPSYWKMKLKLKKFPTDANKTDNRYNVTLLKDQTIVEQLRIILSNMFLALHDLDDEDQP